MAMDVLGIAKWRERILVQVVLRLLQMVVTQCVVIADE
jgi:hypothetical protein